MFASMNTKRERTGMFWLNDTVERHLRHRREVDWSIKNHTLKMVIDPWPGVRSGGQWQTS